ncbi:excinuclease ABC subunit C [Idiomarina sp. X4]|uniref:excinuclease ABC subunit UvrC n=1 Tax=Idiomarina sp. X4 TaxID=2055892 RepID=UPI000C291509|nr:excinuclease ABC subunit UvrC [Idiomarina sp. X4]ATZ74398.1 excinuclease ABC subunit C [Idiomarina sp. X4]
MTDSNSITFNYKDFLRNLTHQPGVYRMYDESGDVIYVGKAKDLKKRVSSYFREKVDAVKTQVLVKQIVSMDVTVTDTEADALILENSFIKKYRPRYNVLLRDDKSYPYIILTSHEHPRLGFHRGARREKGDYFGPFPNGSAVRESLNLMQKLFPIRQCQDSYYRARTRPCLQYQLKRCLAPCVSKCTDDEYNDQVQLAKHFLNGKNQQVIDELVKKMEQASEALEFEKAARFRDQIAALRKTQERNSVTGAQQELDVIGMARGNGMTTIQMMFIRDNHLQGSRSYFPKVPADTSDEEVLRAFLLQFYLSDNAGRKTPREIILPDSVEPDEVLAQVMGQALNRSVKMQNNVRGERKQYQQLAAKNAVNALESRLNQQSTMNRRTSALQQVLDFGVPIQRMECFDISHTMGQQTVASCVVFDQNGPKKSDYRRYNITGITPGDDYAAMAKALAKRYDKAREQGNIPDILFIDGGKGQLSQAEKYFEDWGSDAPMLIGVAKGESRKPGLETLIMAGSHETIALNKDASALHLIQHIRDESHRFAITGHRQKRAKVQKTSTLEQIEGIGAKRRQTLLKNLGGLQEVKNASISKLSSVPGISQAMAEKIYYSFRDE